MRKYFAEACFRLCLCDSGWLDAEKSDGLQASVCGVLQRDVLKLCLQVWAVCLGKGLLPKRCKFTQVGEGEPLSDKSSALARKCFVGHLDMPTTNLKNICTTTPAPTYYSKTATEWIKRLQICRFCESCKAGNPSVHAMIGLWDAYASHPIWRDSYPKSTNLPQPFHSIWQI